ncbi:3-dehydroquinate dehydratase [Natrialba hulunbeirensis JCM 10989]|uniref:3-dehydroquinate dehydratase n=1 Tax=Natrialba hulunbeirensis JCM 10989 TaxID=1227493 RepID=L9ZSZ6_9EURY|nr:type I 3-dehydroquinate dehydratase [Natrialba hulunbeirensis]ELY89570.1 3-dehydroquinate dehydratase [Natrialba hulunbeirensis JCM 10989]
MGLEGLEFESFTLAASTADLSEEPAARSHADVIEFRMDLASEPVAALESYDAEYEETADALPVLATNRAAWEGGEAADDEKRLDALAEVTQLDAVQAIDIELASLRDGSATTLNETAATRGVTVVASAHDFEETPSVVAMSETLTDACRYGDVGKLAVTATDRSDALALLTVTHQLAREDEHTVATMAMGAAGSHTRAVAPVYGSRIGYAPVDPSKATAPGQYDLETLSRLVTQLEPAAD